MMKAEKEPLMQNILTSSQDISQNTLAKIQVASQKAVSRKRPNIRHIRYEKTKPKQRNTDLITSVVVPCYNEAERLNVEAFIQFVAVRDDIRLVFVDDGSTDATIATLTRILMAAPDRVDIIMLKENGGKAEAVRQGLSYASQRGDDFIVFLDADLATPLDAVLDFVSVAKRLPEINVVFGSRCGGMGRRVYRKVNRKIISLICAALSRLATGMPIKDTQCGAKLFRNTPQFRTSLSEPFRAGWLFDVELFLRISNRPQNKQTQFFEFPVIEWTEIPGSKVKASDTLKSGWTMLGLIFNQWRIRRKFQRRQDQSFFGEVQSVCCGTHLSFPDLLRLIQLIDSKTRRIEFDLSALTSLSPSLMTAFIELCDGLERAGHQIEIRLPASGEIAQEAKRCGLTAIYSCRHVSKANAETPHASSHTFENNGAS